MQASLLLLIGQTNYTLRTSLERTCRSNCVCVCVSECVCSCVCVYLSVFTSQVVAGRRWEKCRRLEERPGGGLSSGREFGWGGAVQVVGTDGGGRRQKWRGQDGSSSSTVGGGSLDFRAKKRWWRCEEWEQGSLKGSHGQKKFVNIFCQSQGSKHTTQLFYLKWITVLLSRSRNKGWVSTSTFSFDYFTLLQGCKILKSFPDKHSFSRVFWPIKNFIHYNMSGFLQKSYNCNSDAWFRCFISTYF